MRIFLLGKLGSITHWLEDCAAALRADGHHIALGGTRHPAISEALETWLAEPLAGRIARRVQVFAPDLILAIGAFHVPIIFLQKIAALPGRAPLVGWVGDLFDAQAVTAAQYLDLVAYTDAGLDARHREMVFGNSSVFLPHAVNPAPVSQGEDIRQRDPRLIFIGTPTPQRLGLVEGLPMPMCLYGPGWKMGPQSPHAAVARKVSPARLQSLYGHHRAALNIRNETHVLTGLNQRNFQPYLARTAVATDNQADLETCFEPGREVLVYSGPDELKALAEMVIREPGTVAKVAQAGRRRVLAEHTYSQRLNTLLRML